MIARSEALAETADKTTLAIEVPHRPGSLHRALGCFAAEKINLTSLVTKPIIDQPWHYTFFLDLEIGAQAPAFSRAVESLKRLTREIRIIGSYQKGGLINS